VGTALKPNRTHTNERQTQRHEPEFKARVALEVLKGIKTIQLRDAVIQAQVDQKRITEC